MQRIVARHPPDQIPHVSKIINDLRGEPDIWKVAKSVTKPELQFVPSGDVLHGDLLCAKYFCRVDLSLGLYGTDAFTSTEIDSWVRYANKDLSQASSPEEFLIKADDMNNHLKMRSFFSGYSITLADVALWVTLACSSHWHGLLGSNRSTSYKNLVRWYSYLSTVGPFAKVLPVIKGDSGGGGKVQDRAELEELVGAVPGKVVTRFPPEASGFLHIGHAKAALLNDIYAQKYNGRLLIRFDDTNPKKEKEEFEEAILRDLKYLDLHFDEKDVSHTSDHFDVIIEKGTLMIKAGLAYCDCSTALEMKDQREQLKASPYRDTPVEKNLEIWKEMQEGSEEGSKWALRAKIDPKSVNGTMRDPVIFRVITDISHARTGDKYKVYPIYNFSCPIVDSIEGVTHALRSNEYHDSEEQYYWLLQHIPGLLNRSVRIKDFSRLRFTFTVMSKRKLQHIVDSGVVEDWDDPRFPTLQGLKRRGLTIEALRAFIKTIGDSKKLVNMDMLKLWATNKQFIDPIIPRYTCIRSENIVPLTLTGIDGPETFSVARHRKNASLGNKDIWKSNKLWIEQEDAKLLSAGDEITLMNWGNIIITSADKKEDGTVSAVAAKLHLAGDFKTTTLKITWIAQDHTVPVSLVEYDTLLTKDPKKGEDFREFINFSSKVETAATAESAICSLPLGSSFQFERVGYYRYDKDREDGTKVFVNIPDGHSKDVFLGKKIQTKQVIGGGQKMAKGTGKGGEKGQTTEESKEEK